MFSTEETEEETRREPAIWSITDKMEVNLDSFFSDYFHCIATLLLLHQFNDPLSGATRVNRYQKGKTNLDFTEARDSEWQCHQLGHVQVCTSLQTDNNSSTPQLKFFTGRMPFLLPNQQRLSTEGIATLPCQKI